MEMSTIGAIITIHCIWLDHIGERNKGHYHDLIEMVTEPSILTTRIVPVSFTLNSSDLMGLKSTTRNEELLYNTVSEEESDTTNAEQPNHHSPPNPC